MGISYLTLPSYPVCRVSELPVTSAKTINQNSKAAGTCGEMLLECMAGSPPQLRLTLQVCSGDLNTEPPNGILQHPFFSFF